MDLILKVLILIVIMCFNLSGGSPKVWLRVWFCFACLGASPGLSQLPR